ncbi:site-specific DNA-methyltransferase [Saccharopolyspora gloriosae]|uniref:DNA-methyltransferase n=1 Tax=Saccharopolyspora gloriosae TaxID=455344 RepID=UPI001FB8132E|nr:site-specific DNA-methyltransferase [Saccharopolyspora gloriosae]
MNNIYYHYGATKLHLGDALDVMGSLPKASVDCVVTSPPHWGLRDYGTAKWIGGNLDCHHTLGTTPHQRRTAYMRHSEKEILRRCRKCQAIAHDQQYGLEPTLDAYITRIRHVCHEIKRLLTPQGTCWINLRDSYSYHRNGTGRAIPASDDKTALNLQHKSLMGIPWRVALELQNDGWIIRNAIVWHKPNAAPDPARDRFSNRYEMLFLLTKQPQCHLDSSRVLDPLSQSRPHYRKNHYGGKKLHTVKTPWSPDSKGKNPGDVWSMSTRPLAEAHCAPFPVDLPYRCIASGCPSNGLVLDPFSGAGTTGLAAHRLGRRYQGIDLRADYHDIALRRLHEDQPPDSDLPALA